MRAAPTSTPPPQKSLARSQAFREASLRSEVRRAYGLIGVIVLIILFVLMRESRRELDYRVQLVGIAGTSLLFIAQVGILACVRWAQRYNRTVPTWFIAMTVVAEIMVPTGMMASHLLTSALPPYAALSSPPVLAYGLLIGLNTLRLRPWLCVMSGTVAGASYAALLAYVAFGMGLRPPADGLPHEAFVTSALLIFISGLAAAWGASEIRAHAEAALDEAESRRRAERLERDLSVARSIQRALLPRAAPVVPGFEIAGWNRPADQTGGDYYDWQRMPDGRWIVSLADVSGHGIGPALVTAACRAYVRASSAHHADLPSLTERINRLLADDLPEGRFVTMASVLIDPGGGPLALLSAGHGPIVLLVGATGEVRDILPHDIPLAVAPETRFGPAISLSLEPGDVLALVTDGFVEWPGPVDEGGRVERFGMPRLRESLRRHADLSAAAMIEAVAADVATFAGNEPQQDDLTMVVIRRVS